MQKLAISCWQLTFKCEQNCIGLETAASLLLVAWTRLVAVATDAELTEPIITLAHGAALEHLQSHVPETL